MGTTYDLFQGQTPPFVYSIKLINSIKMVRKFFVGGNWKMNGDKASIDAIIDFLVKGPTDPNVDVVVSCPSCYLMYVREKLPSDRFGVAAQNCYKAAKGAFTGELSPL